MAIATNRAEPTSPSFYFFMTLVMAAIVVAGFGPTYTSALAPPGLPFWVHLHGAAMVSWIVLFAAQSWLVSHKRVPLHRWIGGFGMGLAAAIVPLGLATTALAVRRGAVPPFLSPPQMLSIDILDVVTFASLVSAAYFLRRKSEWHKRLLLCATILLMTPALGRILPNTVFAPAALLVGYLVMILLVGVGAARDAFSRRAVHPAYWLGAGAITLVQITIPLLAQSAIMSEIVAALVASRDAMP